MKKNFLFYLLFIDLLILNSAIVFLYLNNQKTVPINQDPDYQSYVDGQIDQLKQSLVIAPSPSSSTPSPASTSVPAKSVATKQTLVSYIPIPGSGQTLNNQWTDIPGTEFYIAKQDFSGLKKAYFEANLRLFNGNGKAYLRLFDVTNGIEVWGSQLETSSQQDTMVSSSEITLRQGNNVLRVQAKSLTADTTIFTSGRLKLIIEN